jgi:hypothetical protein
VAVVVAVGGRGVGVETATVGAGVAVFVGVSSTAATCGSTVAEGVALLQAVKSQLKRIRQTKKDLMSGSSTATSTKL